MGRPVKKERKKIAASPNNLFQVARQRGSLVRDEPGILDIGIDLLTLDWTLPKIILVVGKIYCKNVP